MGDVIIDGLTGANRLVILDANGKIPALDGSNVTLLAGANFSTGTIPVARIDTGTAAGKVVKLDGNAKLPAVSGAALTGITGATKNASNPVIATNPSGGVGTEWQNTTTGEIFICTDATAGANVWTSTGGRSGDIEPAPPFVFGGTSYGYNVGGYTSGGPPGSNTDVERFSFTSDGNSSDVADLSTAVHYNNTCCNTGTAGYVKGGINYPPTTDRGDIQKFIFSSEANCTDVGDLLLDGEGRSGSSSGTHGYTAGGTTTSGGTPYFDSIEKFSYSAEGTSIDVGNILAVAYVDGSGANSLTYGYVMGGYAYVSPGTLGYIDMIQRYSYSSDGNAVDTTANLTFARNQGSQCSSTTYVYYHGGSAPKNAIDKHQFDTSNDSTDVGDLLADCWGCASATSTTYGYSMAGGSPYHNTIQKYAFASDGNATDVGDLATANRYGASGIQT